MKLHIKGELKDIKRFLDSKSPATSQAYRTGLMGFLSHVFEEKNMKTHIQNNQSVSDFNHYNELSMKYLQQAVQNDLEHEIYIESYLNHLTQKNSAPKSMRVYKAAIVGWLRYNSIKLEDHRLRAMKIGQQVWTQDRIPTCDEIRRLLDHSGLMMKTFILVQSSSGMRPNELLSLRWKDIDFGKGMIRIRGESTKTKSSRLTFISVEAMPVLKEWQNYLPEFVKNVESKTKGKTIPDINLVFPINYTTLNTRFLRIAKNAGLYEPDASTGRSRIHLHGFRKYFRTHLPRGSSSGDATDITEYLMGHTGYLTSSYLRLTDEDIENFYREAEHVLWIYRELGNKEDFKLLQKDNEELRYQLEKLASEVNRIRQAHEAGAAELPVIRTKFPPKADSQ